MLIAILALGVVSVISILVNGSVLALLVREGRDRANGIAAISLEAEAQARASRHAIEALTNGIRLNSTYSPALLPDGATDLSKVGKPVDSRPGFREVAGSVFYSAAWLDD